MLFCTFSENWTLDLYKAKVKLEDIVREGQYEGFDSNIFDKALSKRGKIFRRLINKGMFKTVIFLLNTEEIIIKTIFSNLFIIEKLFNFLYKN